MRVRISSEEVEVALEGVGACSRLFSVDGRIFLRAAPGGCAAEAGESGAESSRTSSSGPMRRSSLFAFPAAIDVS